MSTSCHCVRSPGGLSLGCCAECSRPVRQRGRILQECWAVVLLLSLALLVFFPLSLYSPSTVAPPSRVANGLLALYTFDEAGGDTIQDVSNVGIPLPMTIDNLAAVGWGPSQLIVQDSVLISSLSAATKITDAVSASNALTVEAWVKPANILPTDLARIVGLAGSGAANNFNLGQRQEKYEMRFRTTATTNKGKPPLKSVNGTASTELTQVVYTRDASGVARFYINGLESSSDTVSGNTSNWSNSYQLLFANEAAAPNNWLGEIFLVAIYDRALTGTEVSQNFMAGEATGPASPIISNIQVTVTETTATVSWDTNLSADSVVDYGETTTYGLGPVTDGTLVTNHSIDLLSLTPGTLYHFQITSTTSEGGSSVSVDQTFTTYGGNEPPLIVQQPQSQSVTEGQDVTFSVQAQGSLPLSYQWQRDGIDIPGETDSSYTLVNATAADDGAQFQVLVSNSLDTVFSDSALLSVVSFARVSADLQVLYTFMEGQGNQVLDVGGVGTPLTLQIDNPAGVQWGVDNLQINSATVIASNGVASKVTDAIKQSHEITLEAWVTPLSNSQSGSPRIATLSQNSQNLNVALRQKSSDFKAKLRTSSTADKGRTVNASGVATNALTHVVFTRDSNGLSTLYVNNTVEATKTIPGTLDNWDSSYPLVLANEAGGGKPWLGSFHLFAMYSRALSVAEVEQNFQAGAVGSVDDTPPVMDSPQTVNVGDTTASVIWNTDEPANSAVDHGPTSAYENGTESSPDYVLNHSVDLTGLQPEFTYHARARSSDTSGNESQSADFTFTTTPDATAPVISNVLVINVSDTGATVTWQTDEDAESHVDYGLDFTYALGTVSDLTLKANHSIDLINLDPATTYHLQVRSLDANGNESIFGDVTFTTAAGPMPPQIEAQPQNQTVTEDQDVTFTVVVSGTPPFVYQWQRDGVDIVNATGSSYTLNNATQADDGASFQVMVTNNLGSVTSDPAVLTVAEFSRVNNDLQVLYTFQENGGNQVSDISGVGGPLHLQIADTDQVQWSTGTLQITGVAQINSTAAATKIIDAVKLSNEITLEAWLTPLNTSQDGPARIVTLSLDPYGRNVTLGQVDSNYNMRLRTTATTNNGKPATAAANALATNLTHFVYTRGNSGQINIYINNQQHTTATVAGDMSNWDSSYQLALGNELTGDRPWMGSLHLVAIYSRALSETDVGQNYQAGPDGTGNVNQLPIASFSANPVAGIVPLDVSFDATASSDPDGQIVDYSWDFGDGGSASGEQANYQYTDVGAFTATLTVTDDQDGVSVSTKLISVNSGGGGGDIPFSYVEVEANSPGDPHCKATGDINGDGFPDLLVGSADANDGLYWYEYPDWDKHTIVGPDIAGFTTSMQTVDVDSDGDLDVVVPKGLGVGETVWWYENPRPTGDPSVDTWTEHFIGTAGAHDVEVGYINDDNLIDIVVRFGDTTVFLQNNPDDWTPVTVSTRSTEGLALGDIDLDDDIDIAINGRWLENPLPAGDPTVGPWTEHLIDSNWLNRVSVHITHINTDGRPDVVLAPSENAGGRLSWYEGPVDPVNDTWVEHVIEPVADYLHTLKSRDVDLDGDMDLVTAEMAQSDNPDEVIVYRNEGGGSSWQKQVVATTGSHNLRLDDIDNDGDFDLFGVNWSGVNSVDLWRNELIQGGGALDQWQRYEIDSDKPWRSIFIEPADIDEDGLPDIVTGGWWYRNPGQNGGVWVRNAIGGTLNNMATVYDFDGDGDMDVLGTEGVGSTINNVFVWAQNDGSGQFTVFNNIDNGSGPFLQGRTVARLQAGGPLEILLAWDADLDGTEAITVPAAVTSDQWTIRELSTVTEGEEMDHGDIDGDGDLDVLTGSQWLRNDGANWTPFTLHNPTSGEPDRNILADIDNDGDLDAVIGYGHDSEHKLAWYEQPAEATDLWTEHLIANLFKPQSVDVGDLDGDGDLDIVVGEHNTQDGTLSRLFVYENVDGNGATWQPHLIHTGDEHHDGAQLVDIDLDGDLDIISIGWNHNKVLLYENQGNVQRFAVVGDYGVDNANELAVANMMKSWRPQFIVTTGDNSYNERPIDDNVGKYFADFIGNYIGIYAGDHVANNAGHDGSLPTYNRFFPSVGNHDWRDGGGMPAYEAYFTLPGAGLASSNSSGNERYYDVRLGDLHLFIVDSDSMEPDGRGPNSIQAQWLQTQLQQSDARWKLVVTHHPPYSSADAHGNTGALQWPFQSWGATAVLSGHDHTYERLVKNGFPYFVNGLGGQILYGLGTLDPDSQVFYADDFGAMLVVVCSNSITFKFYSLSDGLVDSYSLGGPICKEALQ